MKTILLVSHSGGTPGGPPDKFYHYLKSRHQAIQVVHPIFLNRGLSSSIQSQNIVKHFTIYPMLQYFLEGMYTFFYVRQVQKTTRIDGAICFDSLAFFHIYLLKKILKIQKVTFYNVDYSKIRFNNAIMNTIYQAVNVFAYKRCDYFFSLTKTFIENIDPEGKFYHKNFIVRSVVNTKNIRIHRKKMPYSLVHAGSINYNMDFSFLLQALDKIKREGCNFVLHIYGAEKPEKNLTEQIVKLNLKKNIIFKGIVSNNELVSNILPSYMIGISPYMGKGNSLAHDHMFLGTDLTAKLVDYIAAGLPIITTRIIAYFDNIEKYKFGFLVSNTDQWYKAIKRLLFHHDLYQKYRTNALKFAEQYDEDKVLTPLFKKIL